MHIVIFLHKNRNISYAKNDSGTIDIRISITGS